MTIQTPSPFTAAKGLQFNLGQFAGFNFRTQSALDHWLTAEAVVNWDHARNGGAEFWPAGDVPEVALLFKPRSRVTAAELLDLDRVLQELGGDSRYNFLQIYFAVNICGDALETLSAAAVHDHEMLIFSGTSFPDLRRDAAYGLFELHYPEAFRVWKYCQCEALTFDPDRFLDSPVFRVEEVELGGEVTLLVAAR